MSVKQKIKALLSVSGVQPKDLGEALGVSEATAVNRVSLGFRSISDLVKTCERCGASLTITAKDGTVFNLGVDDLEEGARKRR